MDKMSDIIQNLGPKQIFNNNFQITRSSSKNNPKIVNAKK